MPLRTKTTRITTNRNASHHSGCRSPQQSIGPRPSNQKPMAAPSTPVMVRPVHRSEESPTHARVHFSMNNYTTRRAAALPARKLGHYTGRTRRTDPSFVMHGPSKHGVAPTEARPDSNGSTTTTGDHHHSDIPTGYDVVVIEEGVLVLPQD
jgi:hypothetical protein